MASSGMLRRVALVLTDVSEERIATVVRETRIGELGATLAADGNTTHPSYLFTTTISLVSNSNISFLI
jgi:hypothetical protein